VAKASGKTPALAVKNISIIIYFDHETKSRDN
jgi:hypothetical protein